ncbi:MAG: endonuclease III domain-containing protein [Candidatus Omnitrophota bacterium]
MKRRLKEIYQRLYGRFGPQDWWPADSPFEVMVGAILTQNTSWQNVERAIANLKAARCLSLKKMRSLPARKLKRLIRPAGYYNIKASRLKNFLDFLQKSFGGSLKRMAALKTEDLRLALLSVSGIGPETADSILLYAFGRPVFVVDAYTRRWTLRHGFIAAKALYEDLQELFMTHLPPDAALYNEYHALIVRLGKDYCRKTREKCELCPLNPPRFRAVSKGNS